MTLNDTKWCFSTLACLSPFINQRPGTQWCSHPLIWGQNRHSQPRHRDQCPVAVVWKSCPTPERQHIQPRTKEASATEPSMKARDTVVIVTTQSHKECWIPLANRQWHCHALLDCRDNPNQQPCPFPAMVPGMFVLKCAGQNSQSQQAYYKHLWQKLTKPNHERTSWAQASTGLWKKAPPSEPSFRSDRFILSGAVSWNMFHGCFTYTHQLSHGTCTSALAKQLASR